ncbi:hypothetical protein KBI23_03720 [bacterium]|nr:hypothetical protein [bacterium]MBP9810022.1 hypothetical protein [bacterium]
MTIKYRHGRLLALALTILIGASNTATAGPLYGVDPGRNAFQRTMMLLSNPDPYNHIPAGRAGGTIGLAVIPRLTPDSDAAERALGELVGHIPAINMAIILPKDDILYLFKFLKHLKATGRKVDVLLIGGHSIVNDENDPDPIAINLKASGYLDTTVVNVPMLQRRIEILTAEKRTERAKEACERLKLIKDGSSALVPGAQLLLHSCYLGVEKAENLTQVVSTALLGVNGGTAYGPNAVIGHTLLSVQNPEADPKTYADQIGQSLKQRSIQLCQSLKSGRLISPGEAFINTNSFHKTTVRGGLIKLPCQCDPAQNTRIDGLQRGEPEISQENPRAEINFKIGENSITGVRSVNGTQHQTTVVIVPPPPVVTPGKYFTVSGSLSGDRNNSPFCTLSKGYGFDLADSLTLDNNQTQDQVELVTWPHPSERQQREMWIAFNFNLDGTTLQQKWRYSPQGGALAASRAESTASALPKVNATTPSTNAHTTAKNIGGIVGLQSKVTPGAKQPQKSSASRAAFRRTGPFITQKKLYDKQDYQISIGENEVTFSGKDLYQKENVSCTLKFDSPPEELTVGDHFMLNASLEGHEDVSPIAGFLHGSWIKAAVDKDKNIGLGRDFRVPSNSSSYEVIDYLAKFDAMAKADPTKASQFAAWRNKLPSIQMHISGPTEVTIEWKYVKK